jgi:hypothetical protein
MILTLIKRFFLGGKMALIRLILGEKKMACQISTIGSSM